MHQEIEYIAQGYGMDMVGIADLTPAMASLVDQGGAVFERYPRAVSLGFGLANDVVDAIAEHSNRSFVMNYIHHIYNVVNHRLDQAALSVAQYLMRKGYRAFIVPASQVLSYETYAGLAPHKTAAHLSGLGWIGKSALLVTREFGPRVRFATVYTDAPLPSGIPAKNRCGSCDKCVDVCPPGAITGESFSPDKPRDHIYVAGTCNQYMKERRISLLGKHVFGGNCGLCVQACPFAGSRRATEREATV